MSPASRTPEGKPNRCPICGKEVRLEPSRPPGDAPCPHCGHLLWFASPATSTVVATRLFEDIIFRQWTEQLVQLPDELYFHALICQTAKLLAAKRGAVWTVVGAQLKRESEYREVEFPETPSDQERSAKLLRQVAVTGEPLISDPIQESQACEANRSLLLAVPVKRDGRTIAIIEIVQVPGAVLKLMQDNLRSLARIGDFAGDRIGRLVDASSASDAAVAVPSVSKKHWWQAWKKK